ncbi:hypothetical protein C8Q79DRAFT_903853, partial [Trametes meyenii]
LAGVHSTVRTWLAFPPPSTTSRIQGTFIRHLTTTLSSSVLLLDEVWSVFCRPRHVLLVIVTLPSTVSSSSAYKAAVARLKHFIIELLPILTPDTPPTPPTSLQTWTLKDLDYYLPFRQHAPQVLNARMEGAALHPDIISSPGALASAFCFRGIWYRSQFSIDYPEERMFSNLAAWQTKRLEIIQSKNLTGKEREYFCNIRAYGAPAHDQKEEHIATYFEMEAQWNTHFSQGQKVPYPTAQAWIQRNLPGMGKLTSALCASDLVYAGLVEMPSVGEMGNMVKRISSGAFKGLRALGLVASDSSDNTFYAFCSLYDSVDHSLTSEQKEQITYDPIMFEHLLCKYHHSHHKLW